MRIRDKLLIPVGVQAFALVAVVAIVLGSMRTSRRSLEERASLGKTLAAAESIRQMATEYLARPVPAEAMETSLHQGITDLAQRLDTDEAVRLASLAAQLRRVGQSKRRNLAIEKELLALTDHSKSQSDAYMQKTVSRLVKRETRESVTDLERMVILGANVNTSSQLAIQKLFYRMAHDLAAKDELLAFLATAIDNASADIERLRNTPFQGLPVAAHEANRKIVGLVKEYTAMRESIAQAQADNDRLWGALLPRLDARAQQSQIQAARSVNTGFIVVGAVCGLASLATAVMVLAVGCHIGHSLGHTVARLKDICEGEGDLTRRLPVTARDEIGDLSRWFNAFVDKLQRMMVEIAGGTRSLAGSAGTLSATAAQLAGGAEETTSQSAHVAAAAEQMSANMRGMAASTEQMSSNVRAVASAVEELTASIGEVAKNAEQAAHVAENAARLAADSNARIGELGDAASQIGKVIEVIEDIAEQTNLLALNATIEAARAGEAGKGFAVVASEVKELARQTASATEDIRKRIGGIQDSTGLAVQSIGDIGGVVQQVNELSRTIASAVEEQSIATKEIARNVSQSSTVAQTVARGVTESASASQEITRNIAGVDEAAKQTAHGAAQTQTAGSDLSRLAEHLQSLVGQFKTGDQASVDGAGT